MALHTHVVTVEFRVTVPHELADDFERVKEQFEGEVEGDITAHVTASTGETDEDGDDIREEYEVKGEIGEITWQEADTHNVV